MGREINQPSGTGLTVFRTDERRAPVSASYRFGRWTQAPISDLAREADS